jgi:adenylylsulfate kinase-like enzyme|tara:strand:- start:1008 stop:1520 length:513 start_codon:yes stop_codon:yes gene_type:complete
MRNKNFSIWLIGPSAAGKTTISKLLYEYLKKENNLILVDGDKIRNLYENNLGYDKESRIKNTHRYINLVKWLMEYNISSIAAVISPFQNEREICRKNIKNYFEIYLKSTLEERIKRDKKKLYLPAINGEKKNVIDVDIPFEVPNKCDLEIETDNKSPANIIEEILKQINI